MQNKKKLSFGKPYKVTGDCLMYNSSGGWKEYSNQLFNSHPFPTSRALGLSRYCRLYTSLAEDVTAFGWRLLGERAHTDRTRKLWLLWWWRRRLWARLSLHKENKRVENLRPYSIIIHGFRNSSVYPIPHLQGHVHSRWQVD